MDINFNEWYKNVSVDNKYLQKHCYISYTLDKHDNIIYIGKVSKIDTDGTIIFEDNICEFNADKNCPYIDETIDPTILNSDMFDKIHNFETMPHNLYYIQLAIARTYYIDIVEPFENALKK